MSHSVCILERLLKSASESAVWVEIPVAASLRFKPDYLQTRSAMKFSSLRFESALQTAVGVWMSANTICEGV